MGIDASIDNISSKVFDNFKKLTPALFSLAIISGLLLFLPENILKKMALDNLPDTLKMIIGVVFLLCVALIVTIVLFSLFSKLSYKRKYRQFKKNQKKKLVNLSPQQRRIIHKLMHSNDKSIQLDANSGDTIYLKTNLFIHQPQQIFSVGFDNEMILTYVPEPWLIDLYSEEPELFK